MVATQPTSSADASWVREKPPPATSVIVTPCAVVSFSRAVKTPSMVVENSEHPVSLVASEGGDSDKEPPASWKACPSKKMMYVYPQLRL